MREFRSHLGQHAASRALFLRRAVAKSRAAAAAERCGTRTTEFGGRSSEPHLFDLDQIKKGYALLLLRFREEVACTLSKADRKPFERT